MLKTRIRKKSKRKKTRQYDEIVPEKHERVGNLNFYSEEIVKEIIDKLLSLTKTRIKLNKINNCMPDLCLKEIKMGINLSLQLMFLEHDNDDFHKKIESIKTKKYSNSYKQKKIVCKNRNNQIKFKKRKLALMSRNLALDGNKNFLNLSYEKKDDYAKEKFNYTNYWGILNQPKSYAYHRIATLKNKVLSSQKTANHIEEEEEHHYKKKSYDLSFFNKGKSIILNDENTLKKKSHIVLEMNSIKKLEESIFAKPKESDEISELRKQKIEEIIKQREKELVKSQNLKKLGKKKKNKYDVNSIKILTNDMGKYKLIKETKKINEFIENQIKKGNFTLDCKGNIVILNEIDPDKLAEFPSIFMRQRNLEIINQNNDNEKIPDLIDNSIYDNKLKKKDSNKYKPVYLKYKIEPSGSNYEIFTPEVGVIILEKGKKKAGGINYFDKYKKYSLGDYKRERQEFEDYKYLDKREIYECLNKTVDIQKNIDIKKKMDEKMKEKSNKPNNNINGDNKAIHLGKTYTSDLQRLKRTNRSYFSKASQFFNDSRREISLKRNISLLDFLSNKIEKSSNIDKDNYVLNMPASSRINQRNIFLKKMENIRRRENSFLYKDIDSFNKNIILGKLNKSGSEGYFYELDNSLNNLPIIPLRNNKFNSSVDNYAKSTKNFFYRTRTKKSITDSKLYNY